jgi:hypothetical protein
MGERQRHLLETTTTCDRNLLASAWDQWEALLGYKFSEYQRTGLLTGSVNWGDQWQTYYDIQKGLYGNTDEHEAWENEWQQDGELETAVDADWEMFWQVKHLLEEQPRPMRDEYEVYGVDPDFMLQRRPIRY